MKSFLIVGAGTLGHHLVEEFEKLNCETMVVDMNEQSLQDLMDIATSCRIADCTNEEALRSLGVDSFDCCFVCVGGNFQQSLVITSALKENGAKKVYALADEDVQAKFLLRNGADEVIFPQRDVCRNIALSESSDSLFDCIRLTEDYGVYEIEPLRTWIGKSLRTAQMRNTHGLMVLAVKRNGSIEMQPDADYVIAAGDHLLVLGKEEMVKKVAIR